jgi:hypothetical protein
MASSDPHERPPVFVAMPFAAPFDQIYSVLQKTMDEIGLETLRADEIPKGRPFMENVFNAIEQAGMVIGVTSRSNANVTYELGFAQHEGKETILLTDEPSQIPTDLQHFNHLVYSPDDMPELAKEVTKWVKNSRLLSAERSRAVLRRGEVFDAVIDGTFYLQKSRPTPSKTEIKDFLTERTTMPQRLLYLTEEGQSTYLTLCEDPEYAYYQDTLQYVVDHSASLVDRILEHGGSSEVDFISLGPGNGKKDAVLLRELLRRACSARYTYYYPYDVSGGLLLEAIRNILAGELPRERLRIKAIEADVAHLAEFKKVFDFRQEPNVYSLLGGLDDIGNEVNLLTLLHQLMNPEDCLLLETRKKVGSGPEALGRIELNKRLDLAPLLYIGAKVDRRTVEYREVTSTSSFRNARTVAATVPELELDGKTHRNLTLFSVHYYDDDDIRRVLREVGFRVLFSDDDQPNSLFYIVSKA